MEGAGLRELSDTPVVSQRSEAGQGILGSKAGRGNYDMWYDWVVKALVSSCISVGCPLTEHLDLSYLTIPHNNGSFEVCSVYYNG